MIKPALNFLLVKKVLRKNVGDMVLPDVDTNRWEIVSLADGVRIGEATYPFDDKFLVPGQTIFIKETTGHPVEFENETYHFVDYRDVLGIENGE